MVSHAWVEVEIEVGVMEGRAYADSTGAFQRGRVSVGFNIDVDALTKQQLCCYELIVTRVAGYVKVNGKPGQFA